MAATFQRKLTVTADTSGLAKGAKDVQGFGRAVDGSVDMLKRGSAQLTTEAQKMTASFAKQAQSASREMAMMSKAIEADLKPMAAEMRKMQTEALKATEALQKRTLSDARAAEALRKNYDTGYANASKFLQIETQVQTQIAKRNLTVEQGSAIMAGAAVRFKQMGDGAKTANDNVKLTSGQMQGLGYQINDVGTMLAMGASPFQVLASQAGQVVQVLGDGPGGMKGSLAAIGSSIASFATTTNLIVGGLAAAAGAAVYFATRSDSSIKTAEEMLEGYKKLVDSLDDSYARAGDAAERYMTRNRKEGPDVALAAIQGTTAELMASLQQDIEALVPKTQNIMDESIRSFAQLTPEVLKSQDAIRSLGQQLERGDITAAQFREQMAKIRIDPKTPPEIVKIADKLLAGSLNARDLALALGAVGEAAAAASGKMGRLIVPSSQDMTAPFGGTIEMLKRLRPEEFSGLVDGLQDQARALEDTKNKSNEYGESMKSLRQSLSGTIDDLQLQIDTFGQSAGAIAKAKFAADALRDAQDAATEAGRASIDPEIVAFIEKQADQYGRLTDQLNTATEAQRAQAKAAEDVNRQQERVREFAADLEFERSIATLPDAEQQVRESLRGLGVEYDSFEGQQLAAGMRYNDALRETRDEMENTRDAAADFVSTLVDGLSSGKGALDTLISAFAGLGKQMAFAGLEKLMGGLFGTGGGNSGQASGIGGLASAFSGLTQAITKPPTASQVFGGGSTFSAPTVSVQRGGALQALTQAAPAAAAAASGEMLKYAGRFNSGVDSRLMTILKTASSRFDMPVTAVSGLRPGDKRFHGQGIAADVSIAGLGNYQDAGTFRTYEKFAQLSKQVQSELFPELEGMLRWGGYFSGGKGKYGAVDNMHFDLAGSRVGMGGGSWEGGLTAAQRRMWPGAQSVGMGSNDNALREAVKLGTTDYARSVSSGGAPSLLGNLSPAAQQAFAGGFDGFSTNTASWRPGAPAIPGTGGAAGGGFGGALGGFMSSPVVGMGMNALSAAASGYQSGSPAGGALSGALSGFMMSGGNPLGAVIGAIAGGAGGLKSKSKHTREKQAELDASMSAAWETTEIAA